MTVKHADIEHLKDWIEVLPVAVTTDMDPARPVMIFREKNGQETLPVWLSPLDAGIAITQHHVKSNASSPHDLASKVFNMLNLKLDKCFFKEIKGHHQIVELRFSGRKDLKSIETRADQAISFCLRERAQFFCTRDFMQLCRDQDAHIVGFSQKMQSHPGMGKNKHPYMM